MAKRSHPLARRLGLAACVLTAVSAGACTRDRATTAAAAAADSAAGQVAATPAGGIGHVFIIMLENKGYDTTFSAHSPAPYLADTLVKKGALLTHYYGTGHFSLDNYISLISGQAPNRATQEDCGIYSEFVQTGTAANGQAVGEGCVYPASVKTIADQLAEHGFTWKGYMEDMGNDPKRESATCGHAEIGQRDSTSRATPGDQYAAKHNPFVYFHSIIDSPACHTNVVALPHLESDLGSVATTPNYAFISPSLCHDGHDHPCVNGEPGGLVSANEFLQHWVPLILQSPAFRQDGLLIITFDEATLSDATACCNEQPGPNVKAAGIRGPGGGRIGAVLLSPFITPGTVSDTPYNHYSMLKSIEDIFHLPYLGYAGQDGLAAFGSDVYTNRPAAAAAGGAGQ